MRRILPLVLTLALGIVLGRVTTDRDRASRRGGPTAVDFSKPILIRPTPDSPGTVYVPYKYGVTGKGETYVGESPASETPPATVWFDGGRVIVYATAQKTEPGQAPRFVIEPGPR